jgi:hypothetical protein
MLEKGVSDHRHKRMTVKGLGPRVMIRCHDFLGRKQMVKCRKAEIPNLHARLLELANQRRPFGYRRFFILWRGTKGNDARRPHLPALS